MRYETGDARRETGDRRRRRLRAPGRIRTPDQELRRLLLCPLSYRGGACERVKGIEPSQPAWKAGALPLSYTRADLRIVARRATSRSPSSTAVGLAGFEPATSASQTPRANQAALQPAALIVPTPSRAVVIRVTPGRYLPAMRAEPPPQARRALSNFRELDRTAQVRLVRELRRLGWSYTEIVEATGCPKGTVAYWCRDVILTPIQVADIRLRRPPGVLTGQPVDTQRGRRAEVEEIRRRARQLAMERMSDPFFVAGVVMYWAEGAKTVRRLSISHSEPAALRLFVSWVGEYLQPSPRVALQLFLHADNDLGAATDWWSRSLGFDECYFTKPFIKPDGTGHRKNHLPNGVCRAQIARSTDSWYRTTEFIDVVRASFGSTDPRAILPAGR